MIEEERPEIDAMIVPENPGPKISTRIEMIGAVQGTETIRDVEIRREIWMIGRRIVRRTIELMMIRVQE